MDQKSMPQNPAPADGYFVEIIGQDGIKHHIGPFEKLTGAEAWIAQNERTEPAHPRHKQSA